MANGCESDLRTLAGANATTRNTIHKGTHTMLTPTPILFVPPDPSYQIGHSSDLYMDERTAPAVADTVARLYRTSESVRLFLGDPETGKTWNREWNVCGHIGASTGHCKSPLIINNNRAHGGEPILTHCVVGILTRHGWAYKHPAFDNGVWTAGAIDETYRGKAYGGATYRDGELIRRHGTLAQAERHRAFMNGERMRK